MQENCDHIEKLPPVLTLARVAEIAGVSRKTVRRWMRAGLLTPNRMQQGGSAKNYFNTAEVLRALAGNHQITSETKT
jgi:predicted site-specific integrase-resolvase